MHAFPAVSKSATLNIDTNAEGLQPQAGLLLSGDTLYGTTLFGGTDGTGTLFALNTNGSSFQVLHQFAPAIGGLTNLDGMEIRAGLMLSGNTLYGTAGGGGTNHWGTVFSINTDSSGFKVLHTFGANVDANGNPLDGGLPEGGLVLSGGTLYGTAAAWRPFLWRGLLPPDQREQLHGALPVRNLADQQPAGRRHQSQRHLGVIGQHTLRNGEWGWRSALSWERHRLFD